jgi:hypothetical protein
VNRYESHGKNYLINDDCQSGPKPKINDKQKEEIQDALKKNPLKLGLGYSIWNGILLRKYINSIFGIDMSKIYCDKLLETSDTIYKSSNYDAGKNKELVKLINNSINEYKDNQNYSVWYFDTYYLGKNLLEEPIKKFKSKEKKEKSEEIEKILRGNDINIYKKYILYGFYNELYNGEELFQYDIKNHITKKNNGHRENFINVIKEFIDCKKQEFKENVKLVIILSSNNIFKTLIDKDICENMGVEVMFLPKNLLNINKINEIWNKIHESNFTVKGKVNRQIQDEFDSIIQKIF